MCVKSLKRNTSRIDLVARYFLRRLAMAHRKYSHVKVQYANALADTILVFVTAPICGFLGFILILSLRWAPNPITRIFGSAPQVIAIIIAGLSILFGYWLLNNKMKRHLEVDPSCYLEFDNEKDVNVVFLQKLFVLIVSGIVLPTLALFIS
jgi:hypothetical protein